MLRGRKPTAHDLFHLATRGNAMHLGWTRKSEPSSPAAGRTWWCSTRRPTPVLRARQALSENLEDTLFALAILGDDRAVRATYIAGGGCGTASARTMTDGRTGAGRSGHRRIGVALRPHGSEAENDAVGGKSGVEQQVVPERRFAQGVVPRQGAGRLQCMRYRWLNCSKSSRHSRQANNFATVAESGGMLAVRGVGEFARRLVVALGEETSKRPHGVAPDHGCAAPCGETPSSPNARAAGRAR